MVCIDISSGIYCKYVIYIQRKVISGICCKQTFLCAEKLYNVSLKQAISGICLKQIFLCAEKLYNISLKSTSYLTYV